MAAPTATRTAAVATVEVDTAVEDTAVEAVVVTACPTSEQVYRSKTGVSQICHVLSRSEC